MNSWIVRLLNVLCVCRSMVLSLQVLWGFLFSYTSVSFIFKQRSLLGVSPCDGESAKLIAAGAHVEQMGGLVHIRSKC